MKVYSEFWVVASNGDKDGPYNSELEAECRIDELAVWAGKWELELDIVEIKNKEK